MIRAALLLLTLLVPAIATADWVNVDAEYYCNPTENEVHILPVIVVNDKSELRQFPWPPAVLLGGGNNLKVCKLSGYVIRTKATARTSIGLSAVSIDYISVNGKKVIEHERFADIAVDQTIVELRFYVIGKVLNLYKCISTWLPSFSFGDKTCVTTSYAR